MHMCMMNWHYIRGGIYRAVLMMNQKFRNFVHVGLIGCNWIPILLKRIPRLKVEGHFAVLQKDMLPMLSRVERKLQFRRVQQVVGSKGVLQVAGCGRWTSLIK